MTWLEKKLLKDELIANLYEIVSVIEQTYFKAVVSAYGGAIPIQRSCVATLPGARFQSRDGRYLPLSTGQLGCFSFYFLFFYIHNSKCYHYFLSRFFLLPSNIFEAFPDNFYIEIILKILYQGFVLRSCTMNLWICA